MDVNKAMQLAAKLIASLEGFSSTAYYDVNGWAIGYGNHYYQNGTSVKKGDVITKANALLLLQFVAFQKWKEIRDYITVPVTENMVAALTSLAYNWGEGNVRKSQLLKLINSGADRKAIEQKFSQTGITAGGIYNDGLVARRLKELTFFFSSDIGTGVAGGLFVAALVGVFFYFNSRKKKIF